MDNFKNLQTIWNQQVAFEQREDSEAIRAKSLGKIKAQNSKHFWTIGILSILIIGLLFFYRMIYSDAIASKIKGLELMIVVIIVRVVLELTSSILFRKIDFTISLKLYTKRLLVYFRFRRILHFVFTPVIYLLYIIGFCLMLPLFKSNLSQGFYIYVLISGLGFLLVFSFQLFKIIKKDLNDLKYLQNADTESV